MPENNVSYIQDSSNTRWKDQVPSDTLLAPCEGYKQPVVAQFKKDSTKFTA